MLPQSLTLDLVLCICSGHLCMPDGTLEACACKQLPYEMVQEKEFAHAELESLHLALGLPNMVQGLAAFKYCCPDSNQEQLWLVTRSVSLTCNITYIAYLPDLHIGLQLAQQGHHLQPLSDLNVLQYVAFMWHVTSQQSAIPPVISCVCTELVCAFAALA